jgi:hypothetical protein
LTVSKKAASSATPTAAPEPDPAKKEHTKHEKERERQRMIFLEVTATAYTLSNELHAISKLTEEIHEKKKDFCTKNVYSNFSLVDEITTIRKVVDTVSQPSQTSQTPTAPPPAPLLPQIPHQATINIAKIWSALPLPPSIGDEARLVTTEQFLRASVDRESCTLLLVTLFHASAFRPTGRSV